MSNRPNYLILPSFFHQFSPISSILANYGPNKLDQLLITSALRALAVCYWSGFFAPITSSNSSRTSYCALATVLLRNTFCFAKQFICCANGHLLRKWVLRTLHLLRKCKFASQIGLLRSLILIFSSFLWKLLKKFLQNNRY